VYDIYTSLACCLLCENMAEPAADDEPSASLPVENQMFRSPLPAGKGLVLPRSLAADRARKKRKQK
jgi:hypothetical protein